MTGTLLNVLAVLAGAGVGTLLGARLAPRFRDISVQAIGLVTLLIGLQMALQVQNMLILLASMVLGGAFGEALRIEARLAGLGAWLERRLARSGGTEEEGESRFVRGFLSSSLLFCVGPMTILGSIYDGLSGDYRLLAVKSLLDGVSAIALASALGAGVFASAIVVLIYQGGLSLAARLLGSLAGDPARSPEVLEMTAVGGVLILGLGLRLLEVRQVAVVNLLPALALAPLLTALLGGPLRALLPG